MGVGDRVVCLVTGMERFGLTKGNFYRISAEGKGGIVVFLGPVVSIVGLPENVFFSTEIFEPTDTSFEDELIKNL